MKKYKSITVKGKELTSYKCDRCKKELIDNIIELQESYNIQFTGGFGSVFGDGTTIECNLCQYCLYDLIRDFYYTNEEYYE